jgi:hypothetical protein
MWLSLSDYNMPAAAAITGFTRMLTGSEQPVRSSTRIDLGSKWVELHFCCITVLA